MSARYDYGLAIAAAAAPSAPILGSADVQPWVDSNPSGTAEAFQYTATRSGPATAVHVYLDDQNEATQVIGVCHDLATLRLPDGPHGTPAVFTDPTAGCLGPRNHRFRLQPREL